MPELSVTKQDLSVISLLSCFPLFQPVVQERFGLTLVHVRPAGCRAAVLVAGKGDAPRARAAAVGTQSVPFCPGIFSVHFFCVPIVRQAMFVDMFS